MNRAFGQLLAAGCLAVFGAAHAGAQLASQDTPPVRKGDTADSRPLDRLVVVHLAAVPLNHALEVIAQRGGVTLARSTSRMPANRNVTVNVARGTLREAFRQALAGTGLDVAVIADNVLAVTPAAGKPMESSARTGTISGRVTDAKTGNGIAGAEVLLATSRWRTVTDSGGRYHLAEVEADMYTLVVRRLGYTRLTRQLVVRDDQTDTVNVALEPAAARLDELVTTATGRQRRLEVPNDITTINVDSVMRAAPIRSVTDLLENRVPGLAVQHTSGAPGDPARLRLRGAASPLQSNDPIVVVDGIRVYAQQSAGRSANLADNIGRGDAGAAAFAVPSPLDYIDPNSIETIEVVKGPSAATLYGPDAANGVIVITTKKGRAGPPRWTMSADYGRTRMAGQYPDLLLRWGHTLYDPATVLCPGSGVVAGSGGTPCEGDSVKTSQLLNDPATTVLDKGHNTALSLGVSGGTQSLTYSVTGSVRDEVGLVKLPDYEIERYQTLEGRTPPDWMRRPQRFKQWSAMTSLNARLGANADVSLRASLSRDDQQRSTLEQQLPDLMSTFLERSSGLYYAAHAFGSSLDPSDQFRIDRYRTRVTDAATQFTNGVNATWRARHWLTFNATAGLDVQQRADETFVPTSRDTLFAEGGDARTGRLNLGQGTTVTSTVSAGGVAVAPLGHGVQLRFASGANYIGNSISDHAIATDSVPYGTSDIGTHVVSRPLRTVRDDATFGWYIEPTITHPRFTFNLGLRLDGGSAYGATVSGFKLPTFPKLGFSYLLSDESFFPLKSVFQSFRVRAAYGRASTQPPVTGRLRLYGRTYETLADSVAGNVVELQTLGNTALKPERTTELEGGFDADLLDSRLNVIFSGYRRTKNDALLATPVPPSVYGAGVTMLRNIGVVRNTGLEMTVNAQLVRSGGVTWSTQFQLSHNRNKVVRLGPDVKPFYIDGGDDQVGGSRVAAGYPLFGRWATPVLGYADANGDGVLEASEVLLGDTAVYIGETVPVDQFSVNPTVALWHGALTVTAGVSHTGGFSQENDVAKRLTPFSRGVNDPTASLAEQLATGTIVNTPFTRIQTLSTTRFNELSVRYAFPASMARRLGAEQLSIAVQGSNLGLWTNYRGLDPNVNAFATGNSVRDTGVLPEPRFWRVQINANY